MIICNAKGKCWSDSLMLLINKLGIVPSNYDYSTSKHRFSTLINPVDRKVPCTYRLFAVTAVRRLVSSAAPVIR